MHVKFFFNCSPPAGPGFQGYPPPPNHQQNSGPPQSHRVVPPSQNAGNSTHQQPPHNPQVRTQDVDPASTPPSSSLDECKSELVAASTGEEDGACGRGERSVDVEDIGAQQLDRMEVRQRRLERFHSAPVSSGNSVSSTESGDLSKVRTAAKNENQPPRENSS